MKNEKYEFTGQTKKAFGAELKQIRSLVAIASIGISIGDVGGWIEKEENLSVSGDAWVSGDARVSGDAWVYGNAEVLWLSHIGSENGTLTLCRSKDGPWVCRGCWSGTLDEFEIAVKERHGENQYGQEYAAVIGLLRLRANSWSEVKEAPVESEDEAA